MIKKYDTRWININDKLPEIDQEVYYYFGFLSCSVWAGWYDGPDDNGNGEMFHSPYGFLTDDVTHWMPRDIKDVEEAQDLAPYPPRCHYEEFLEENYEHRK